MGWGGAHSSTSALFVDRVAKGKDVIRHNDVECCHEGFNGDSRELMCL